MSGSLPAPPDRQPVGSPLLTPHAVAVGVESVGIASADADGATDL